MTPHRVLECVACGRACPPGQRWCSKHCFALEDGEPRDDIELEDTDDE